MEKYSNELRLIIVKTQDKNGESFAKTVRQLRQVFGSNNAPNESTVRRLITKFETKFTLMDQKIIVTVWCSFWADGVIGPYFFETAAGNALTVIGVQYRELLTEFLWPELDIVDVDDMFFQQDGATCLHSTSQFWTFFYFKTLNHFFFFYLSMIVKFFLFFFLLFF